MCKRCYQTADLYRYWIGRPDQSVQKSVMMKRYTHQLLVAERCFASFRLDEIKQRSLKRYLKHELFMMFGIGIIYAKLHRSKEADDVLEQMWEHCRAHDRKWANHFRYRNVLGFVSVRGPFGWTLSRTVWWIANHNVPFT